MKAAVERENGPAGILDASLTSLDEPARQARIEKLSDRYVHGLMTVVSREMSADLAPMARSVAANAMRGALDEAMGSKRDGAATGPNQDTLRAVVHEQVAPALADVLDDPAFQRALGDAARIMGRTKPSSAPTRVCATSRLPSLATTPRSSGGRSRC